MICKNCNKQYPDGTKFCTICGSSLTEEEYEQAQNSGLEKAAVQPENSRAPKPKKKSVIPVIIIAAVVILAIAAAAAAGGIFVYKNMQTENDSTVSESREEKNDSTASEIKIEKNDSGKDNEEADFKDKDGMYVVYEAADYIPTDFEMSSAVSMIKERLDRKMWTDNTVNSEGSDKIRVEIYGVDFDETTAESIGQTARLYFLDSEGNIVVDGENIKDAYQSTTKNGDGETEIVVSLVFDDKGTEAFAEATQNNIGKPIYIVLDDETISAPTVSTAITDGAAIISGDFTKETAEELADLIKAGSLPFELRIKDSGSL